MKHKIPVFIYLLFFLAIILMACGGQIVLAPKEIIIPTTTEISIPLPTITTTVTPIANAFGTPMIFGTPIASYKTIPIYPSAITGTDNEFQYIFISHDSITQIKDYYVETLPLNDWVVNQISIFENSTIFGENTGEMIGFTIDKVNSILNGQILIIKLTKEQMVTTYITVYITE